MSSSTLCYFLFVFNIFVHVQGNSGEVAARGPCADQSHCLSQWGFCGVGPDYCGNGCQGGPCSGSGGGGGGGVVQTGRFQGKATHYSVSVGYTACGTLHGDHEFIAALNAAQFDPHTPNGNPNRNPLCNKMVKVFGPRGTVNVKVVDKCPGCRHGDLDLSEAAFRAAVGDLGIGVAQIIWEWL